jgi:RNA polymerase subunit RPABC4/transcription elongation factor Spt4
VIAMPAISSCKVPFKPGRVKITMAELLYTQCQECNSIYPKERMACPYCAGKRFEPRVHEHARSQRGDGNEVKRLWPHKYEPWCPTCDFAAILNRETMTCPECGNTHAIDFVEEYLRREWAHQAEKDRLQMEERRRVAELESRLGHRFAKGAITIVLWIIGLLAFWAVVRYGPRPTVEDYNYRTR